MNNADPRASRATVYNALHALARAGLVREVAGPGKAVRFDANLDRHHHFLCDACGTLEDVGWFELPGLADQVDLGRRVVSNYEVTLRGMCASCAGGMETATGERHARPAKGTKR